MAEVQHPTILAESLRYLKEGNFETASDILRHEGLKKLAEHGLHFGGHHPLGRMIIEHLARRVEDPRLATSVGGIALKGPTGVAAGLDKAGRTILGWQEAGANFVQTGGTPLYGQPGEPRVRLLTVDEFKGDHGSAIGWNAFGFNSPGARATRGNILKERESGLVEIPVFAQVTVNKEMYEPRNRHLIPARIAETTRILMDVADGIELGLSSRHTPGMRDSQDDENFVYNNVMAAKEVLGDSKPLGYKCDADGGERRLELICRVAQRTGLDWLSLINATGDKDLKAKYGLDPVRGSLSGEDPRYQQAAVESVQFVYEALGIDIKGMGGAGPEQAVRLVMAGASAIGRVTGARKDRLQTMTKPDKAILAYIEKNNLASIGQMIGSATARGPKVPSLL